MKQSAFFAVLAAAAMTAAISCSKDNNAPSFAGKPITVEVGGPVIEQDPTTSVTLTGVDPYTVAWSAGDKIRIINYTDKVAGCILWDEFTTAAGGALASFSGLPGASDKKKFVAFRCYDNTTITTNFSTTDSAFKYNIPDTQDGTGIKYCLFGTKDVTFEGGNLTIENMALKSALTRFDVPVEANVTNITVTVTYSNGSIGLCGMTNANLLSDFAHATGNTKTITINNGDKVLSGPVYFASRHTLKTKGDVTLTFEFTNSSGLMATKTVLLYKEGGNPAKAISTGSLNYLGAVTFAPGDFK